jgi:hypothetical protein
MKTRDLRLPSGQSVELHNGIVMVTSPDAQHHYRLLLERDQHTHCTALASTYPQLLDIADQMARMEYHIVRLERVAGKHP